MEQDLVRFSVIIPVYNVRQYLTACMESVVHQNTEGIEVIVVDDGSTDDSGKICMEYALRYPFVQYIRKENGGLGAARNTGLSHAVGKYVVFLDSDDYWSGNCIEALWKCISENAYPDIVYFDSQIICESEEIIRDQEYDSRMYHRKGRIKGTIYQGAEFFCITYPRNFNVSACMAAYRRLFLVESGIRFPAHVLYEDNLFSLKSVLRAERVVYLPERLYVRRYRESSIMTSKKNEKSIQEAAKIFDLVMDFAEGEQGKHEKIVFRKILHFAGMLAYSFLQKCYEYDTEQDEIIQKKNEVCTRILAAFREKGRENLYLEEWFLLTIIGQYLKKDVIVMEGKQGYRAKAGETIKELPFFHTDRRVGIYGMGNHTKELLSASRHLGRISADLFVIDSHMECGSFEGLTVLNVRDVPADTEAVVISSFLYEQEMYEMAVQYLPKDIKIVRMYQDEIREVCWEWLVDE